MAELSLKETIFFNSNISIFLFAYIEPVQWGIILLRSNRIQCMCGVNIWPFKIQIQNVEVIVGTFCASASVNELSDCFHSFLTVHITICSWELCHKLPLH